MKFMRTNSIANKFTVDQFLVRVITGRDGMGLNGIV